MRFICASQSHVGLRRKLNEDRVLERPEIGLWAVADGMGGHEAGDVASTAIVEALANLPAAPSAAALTQSALASLQEVNRSLIDLGQSEMSHRTIGSTVVGLVIAGGEYRCFWAGDSRAYRVRGSMITQLSRDHSLVQDLVEAGLVKAEDAEAHPDAHVITRAVGAAKELRVDVATGDAQPGDLFLLGSDGLTRLVNDEELSIELRTRNPMQACESLVATVLARGAPDNVSLIVCRVA